jgi:hypothetical protein
MIATAGVETVRSDLIVRADTVLTMRALLSPIHVLNNRRLCEASIAGNAAKAEAPTGAGTMP